MRLTIRLLSLALAALCVGGCFYDHPLTGGPSKDVNTWLLGVWETRDSDGREVRATVTPAKVDRYRVEVEVAAKPPKKAQTFTFLAWPSRVGDNLFLSLKCESDGGVIPPGSHVFAHIQLLSQNVVRLRGLDLDSQPSASGFRLRQEIRQKQKAGTLYAEGKFADWKRVGEVAWNKDGTSTVFTPIRYPSVGQVEATTKEQDEFRKRDEEERRKRERDLGR